MSFVSGESIKLSIFGSSHGEALGCSLEGLPAGLPLGGEIMSTWLERRRPGQSEVTTQRKEKDVPEILSGLTDGKTDGSPFTLMIRNEDRISSHYDELKYKPRPGHGDLTLFYKYGEYRNYKGGGFLSGRMTAPLVAAGSITLELLRKYGIEVVSYIDRIGDVELSADPATFHEDSAYSFKTRIPDEAKNQQAEKIIMSLLKEGDSIGGRIKTVVRNVPTGIGEPFFDSVESTISSLMFSIPGLKGIEFGSGFEFASMLGSQANDQYRMVGDKIRTESNNNGGILGGITNGMPIEFSVAMKPTSSIRKREKTVNLKTGSDETLNIVGRHDPCIAIRAVPVVQTLTSVAIADLMMQSHHIPRVLP